MSNLIPEPNPAPESVIQINNYSLCIPLDTIHETEDEVPVNEVLINSIILPDIITDTTTNTEDIERKLHNSPPFYLDLNVHQTTELNHPKKKHNHKNKNKNK